MPRRPATWSLVALYATALAATLWVSPDGPVYWDSFGYLTQSLTGRVGGLMLGRPAFVLLSHAAVCAWRALGGPVDAVEPLLRALWSMASALAAPALALACAEAALPPRVALTAGLLVALSPAAAHTAGAVLTDAPSMAVSVCAFALAVRAAREASVARMLAAGFVLGLAAGMREQAVTLLVTPALLALTSPRRRAPLLAAAVLGCALSLGAAVAWASSRQPDYSASIARWLAEMRRERAQHPWSPRDLAAYGAWVLSLGPATVAAAGAALTARWRRALAWDGALLALVLPSALQLAALAFYQDIAFSPRYLLAALPCALALPAARVIDASRLRALALAASVLAVVVAGPVMRHVERPLRDALRALPARLATVAPDAAVVTGQLCPALVHLRERARFEGTAAPRPAWVQVCPGWRWPDDLARHLDALRVAGHPVVLDLRPLSWPGARQQGCLREAEAYARAHDGDVVVWR